MVGRGVGARREVWLLLSREQREGGTHSGSGQRHFRGDFGGLSRCLEGVGDRESALERGA